MRVGLLVAALAAGPVAASGAEPPPAAPGTTTEVVGRAPQAQEAPPRPGRPWPELSEGRHLGAQLDLGFPGALGVDVVFRPWWWLRASAGPTFNLIGWGLRAGVGWVPVEWTVTPSLNFDYGHFFNGDLNRLVSASSAAEHAVLSDGAYDWLSWTIGLEFGSPQAFTFYLRGGLSYFWATVPASDATALASFNAAATGTTVSSSDVKISGLVPSVTLGLIYYFY